MLVPNIQSLHIEAKQQMVHSFSNCVALPIAIDLSRIISETQILLI